MKRAKIPPMEDRIKMCSLIEEENDPDAQWFAEGVRELVMKGYVVLRINPRTEEVEAQMTEKELRE